MNRRPVPFEIGPVHFIGIGGIGMSGIAEIMMRTGYTVQGSDAKASANTERLEKLGAKIFVGHDPANVEGAYAVVYSTAVKPDNPEMVAAREKRLPLVRRAEMLAELMRNAYGTNAKVGAGDWIVVEADESDGTFLKLKSTCAVVTNIDPEHLDHYGEFEAVKKAFRDFVENIPFYGFAAICTDHPEVLAMAARVENRRLVTYGVNPQAEVRAENITMGPDGARYDAVIRPRSGDPIRYRDLHLPMAGHHNVLNSLAAVAVARELGLDEAAIRKGLAEFGGVKRRFTTTGVSNGVRVVDDYGHHPVEIASVLKAARAVTEGKVVAVVQPHRYTRLRDLFDEFSACFADADVVLVADVYAAGEQPIAGVSKDSLVDGLRRYGHRRALPLGSPGELAAMVKAETAPGDLVVLLGAGDITSWAYALPGELEALGKAGA